MNKIDALTKIVKRVGSQAELARKLGVSRNYVYGMLKGKNQISSRLVKKLVYLSQGEVTEHELRPDVFYDCDLEEKKDLLKLAVA